MVAPVVGPTTVVDQDYRGGIYYYYDRKIKWKQKPPFTLNLPYQRHVGTITRINRNNGYGSVAWDADAFPPGVINNSTLIRLNNLSYERLKGKLYSTAGIGVNLVEYNQAVRMIASAASTLTEFSKQLRRLNFPGAARALRMKFIPPGVSVKKSFANNWLEFHFGWTPLIEDIYNTLDVFNDPSKWFGLQKAGARDYLDFDAGWDFGSVIRKGHGSGYIDVTQGARISGIKNIHTHTLEALGLINPASLVWEVVPFSFVVDWFVNVGDYIRSYTDFTGLSIDSVYWSTFRKFYVESKSYRKVDLSPGYDYRTEYIYTERTTSLSGTQLQTKFMKPPSAARAATAISLLLQRMR